MKIPILLTIFLSSTCLFVFSSVLSFYILLSFWLLTFYLFGDFFKILVLWIFLFPLHSLLFVILPTNPYSGIFLHVYSKSSSVVIVFLWDSTLITWFMEVLLQNSFLNAFVSHHRHFTSPGQILHQFFSFHIPTPGGRYKFTLQPWQGQTWGFHGLQSFSLLGPQAESFLTASLGLSAKFYSSFHCGDIFARVLNRVLIQPCLLSWSQGHASLCTRKGVDICCQLCYFFSFNGKNLFLSSDS